VTHASSAPANRADDAADRAADQAGASADGVDRIIGQWAHERPDLDTEPMAIFGRIFRLARLAGDRVEKAYAAYGVGRPEFDLLATLRRAGEPYQLSPGALATARLDRLEKVGMVERSPSPSDRRGVLVRLTPHGFDVVDQAVGAGLAEQERLLAHLPAEKRQQLDDLLREALQQPADPARGDLRWME
jgi:DNA-binding MarR family transcriptional regulator